MRQAIIVAILSTSVLASAGCSGPFTASGTVVDQDGNPLDGVSLHLTGAVANQYEFDAYGGEASFEVDKGRFKVGCRFCTVFHLFFSKDGYYSQSIDLAFFERKRGLKVVMRRVEFPVDLRRFTARIETSPVIDDRVFGFGSSPGERRLSELVAENVVPARPYVTLTSVIEADGSIAVQPEAARRVPARVQLDFSTARGGVILFQPSTMNLREGLKEMYVAPRAEYPGSVVLDPAASHSFFYCTIAGQYCKGIVHAPRLNQRDGVESVTTNIEIHLNPHYGDRSLDDPTPY